VEYQAGQSTFSFKFGAHSPIGYASQDVEYTFTKDTPTAMTGSFEAPMLIWYSSAAGTERFSAKIVGRWSMIPIKEFPKCLRNDYYISLSKSYRIEANMCSSGPKESVLKDSDGIPYINYEAMCDWRSYSLPARASDWPR
jgi:hypothetical protein